MNHPIKIISAVLALILLLFCFCGCSNSTDYVEHFYVGLTMDEVKLSRKDSQELCDLIQNYPLQETSGELPDVFHILVGGPYYEIYIRTADATYRWHFGGNFITRTLIENDTEVEKIYYEDDETLTKKIREYT